MGHHRCGCGYFLLRGNDVACCAVPSLHCCSSEMMLSSTVTRLESTWSFVTLYMHVACIGNYLRYYTNCFMDVKRLAQTSYLRTVPNWLVCARHLTCWRYLATQTCARLPYRCLCMLCIITLLTYIIYASIMSHCLHIYLGKFDMIEVCLH